MEGLSVSLDFLDDSTRTVTLTWNKKDPVQVAGASKALKEHLEKGWIAFVEKPDGSKIQVHRFDPEAEKIILARVAEGG